MVISFSAPDEYIEHDTQLLTLLHDASASPNLKRCALFNNRVDYLDHIIYSGRLRVWTSTIYTIVDCSTPQSWPNSGLHFVCLLYSPNSCQISPLFRSHWPRKFERLTKELRWTMQRRNNGCGNAEPFLETVIRRLHVQEGLNGWHGRLWQANCASFLRKQLKRTGINLEYWSCLLKNAKHAYNTNHPKCVDAMCAVLGLGPYLKGGRFIFWIDNNALK